MFLLYWEGGTHVDSLVFILDLVVVIGVHDRVLLSRSLEKLRHSFASNVSIGGRAFQGLHDCLPDGLLPREE